MQTLHPYHATAGEGVPTMPLHRQMGRYKESIRIAPRTRGYLTRSATRIDDELYGSSDMDMMGFQTAPVKNPKPGIMNLMQKIISGSQ